MIKKSRHEVARSERTAQIGSTVDDRGHEADEWKALKQVQAETLSEDIKRMRQSVELMPILPNLLVSGQKTASGRENGRFGVEKRQP